MKNIKDTEFFSKVKYICYRIKRFIGYEKYKKNKMFRKIENQIKDNDKFIEKMTKKIRGPQ